MRHIILSDDGVNLAENAYHRLLAVLHFPESPRDQKQGLLIAGIEKEEFDRVGIENYKPSEIMTAATRLVENRAAQLYLAGFVSFAFIWLAFMGQKPSLNRASIIASCAANEFRKIEWRPTFDPDGDIRSKAATSDHATLERIFRQYRGVAHIAAARIASNEYLEPLHLWDDAPELLNSFVQSCALFQDNFAQLTDIGAWNLWDVKKHFPSSLRDWPPLTPGDQLMQWMAIGNDQAIKQGLIRRL